MLFLPGRTGTSALFENRSPAATTEELVGIAVELSWSTPDGRGGDGAPVPLAGPARELTLEVLEGQVAEVVDWPPTTAGRVEQPPRRLANERWLLGREGSGRVRARLEVKLGAEIIVRSGDHLVRLPLAAVLERPQRTPAQAPLSVSIERVPWDSLMVEFGSVAESGVIAPSGIVPVSVRYNVLWPDAAEVTVRTTAVLRPMHGSEPIWRDEQRQLVPANRIDPPAQLWNIPAPAVEGSYVLEFHAEWEPSGARESKGLGRLIRRRKAAPVASSATRRVVLAVIAPHDRPVALNSPATSLEGSGREIEVDSVDLGRIRSNRYSGRGRSPLLKRGHMLWGVPEEIVLEASRRERERDRLRNWIPRTVAEAANLAAADESELAWSAVSLRVAHPNKPHRLTVTVVGGDPAALGVALIDVGTAARRSRVLLDACAAGPPVLKDSPPATFSWVVWPDTSDPVLLALNRNTSSSVRLGTVKLHELDLVPSSPRAAAAPPARAVGIYLAGAHALDRFGGAGEAGLSDAREMARNLVTYMESCGATMVILSEQLRDGQTRRRLHGQLEENAAGPDTLDVVLRLLQLKGYSAWLELTLDDRDPLPGLPAPDSMEALGQGLVRVDRQGLADGPVYHPLHPEVRRAIRTRLEQALAPSAGGAAVAGIVLRLGRGPTLLGTPDTGLDDETFGRFVKDTFGPEAAEGVPGLGTSDPTRFAARAKYLTGIGRMPWLNWRSRQLATLYSELAEAARAKTPGAVLALVTPGLYGGAAATEARRVDLAGLAPSQAWRSVGLDLQAWPSGPGTPILLRGVELSNDPLAHDLATSPDLDAKVAACPARGIFLTIDQDPDDLTGTALALSSLPLGDRVVADEPLGHALAALDAQWVIMAAPAVAGHEERLRKFAGVLRALPAWRPMSASAGAEQKDCGVAVRSLSDQAQTFLEIANDTPYPIRLAGILDGPSSAPVEDLGRNLRLVPQSGPSGRQLVIDLLPFGASAIRVGAPRVQLTDVTPYPSEAVLTSMEAQYRELSNQLARLNHGAGAVGEPPNPGFEPEPEAIQQTQNASPTSSPAKVPPEVLGGWKLEGSTGSTIAVDATNPHSGKGSLRVSATEAPISLTSTSFVPSSASSIVIQGFFRSAQSGARIRLWVQGEVGGQPYVRGSDFPLSPDWEQRSLRLTDLPAGGLDLAWLRFEILSPGTLWIDDLHVLGEATPRAVQVNAQRTLLAALQAYRAHRYAEFARLASSHWARHPNIVAVTRNTSASELSGVSVPSRGGPASASALSPGRTVR
jgi:hypothetical protein